MHSVKYDARTRKVKGTSEQNMFRENPKTQLQPTSLKPSGFSASTEHKKWLQKCTLRMLEILELGLRGANYLCQQGSGFRKHPDIWEL